MFSVARRKNSDKQNVDNSRSKIVKESNAIARAQLCPPAESVWEERIIAQVAALNRMEDSEFPTHAFMIGRLVDAKKIDGRKFIAIREACDRLVGTTFKIMYSSRKFKIYSVFDYIQYDNGIITAKFNNSLKPYYLQLKREFSLRSLPEFQRLSSIYSQQIYRFLASIEALSETEVSLEKLHFVTTAPESLKKNFKDFRCRVLEPAEKEINGKTGLKYRWEAIRQGRKVTAIRFIFSGMEASAATPATATTVDDELKKWQRLSNACYEKHIKAGSTCKPNNGQKCTYCRTRGRMAFKDA